MNIDKFINSLKKDNLNIKKEVKNLSHIINDEDDLALFLYDTVKKLLELGDINNAQLIAENINQGYERVDSLVSLAKYLIDNDLLENAKNILNHARLIYKEIEGEWQKAELLNKIANLYNLSNAKEEALSTWDEAINVAICGEESKNPQNSIDSSSVLSEIVRDLASNGELRKAEEVAKMITNKGKKENAWVYISEIKGNGNKGNKGDRHV